MTVMARPLILLSMRAGNGLLPETAAGDMRCLARTVAHALSMPVRSTPGSQRAQQCPAQRGPGYRRAQWLRVQSSQVGSPTPAGGTPPNPNWTAFLLHLDNIPPIVFLLIWALFQDIVSHFHHLQLPPLTPPPPAAPSQHVCTTMSLFQIA